ncbi:MULTISPECIES: hypothetical protein [Bordetella]|uniref:Exported protein n=9 Tax=Bordetella TaxID=517 RepID=Q7VWZ9_BORPE|nr:MULTISPECIES: hypothetical protein [Bordetella]KAK61947.1 hypothetical protein AZ22_1839 [Bordetella bronchiseptica 980-2]KCV32506.1 hypothetical protein L489_2021 [Bordetella bronchiseptica 00-P-2730]KDD54358.1 hypothetical protein L533_1956 [Bordetella bronchiseptica OSU553]SHT37447.1 Uncharacterised protein [Mycobacteroides abscessus subsp. abscessus]AEE67314.1 hypothetical protein BPTD_1998 [Bordetella pertussis CS]
MKKIATLAALAASAALVGPALAGGSHSSSGVGAYGGSVKGSVESISNGSAAAASQVMGTGFSKQFASGETSGYASMGGAIHRDGVEVWTDTSQYSKTNGFGMTGGNAPAQIGDVIVNGAGAFAESNTEAIAKGKFQMFQIGRIGGYGHR